jgi:5-methylcytosine-specific restriction enzyme subunit McrC
VTEPLKVYDLSPFPELSPEDEQWLGRLQRYVRADQHLVRLGDTEEEPDFLVSRDAYGRWTAGRYIGEVAFEGRRLEIHPRLTERVIEQWLGEVLNLVAVPETAARQESRSFIARLMGAVWCRAVDSASRHGPPAFRRERQHEGFYVRGRLEVRRTARLRGAGSPHVASVMSGRDLANDVSRTLVAAERALSSRIGHDHWRTPRVEDVLPQLLAAVGGRPRLPSARALQRIRYTPINLPFKQVAELSWRIAQLQGFGVSSEEGKSEGLLLDVAELWELAVLNCARRAVPGLRVEHATTAGRDAFLLTSRDYRGGLGRLKPDVLVREGQQVVAVIDAKYKRLVDWWPERPQGVDRGDLYQLTSYLSRFGHDPAVTGMLLYPRAQDEALAPAPSTAEGRGPWRTENGNLVQFRRLALELGVDA